MVRPRPLGFLLSLALSAAPPTPEALTAHLAVPATLQAQFTQTRTLRALSRPLVSRGRVVVAKGRGILWQVTHPVALTYVVTPSGLREVGADGRVRRTEGGPGMAAVGRALSALLEGRWADLGDLATVTASGTPDRWEVRLTPRAAAATFFRGATLQGGRVLERLRLEDASGDRMDLTFTGTRTDPPLTEAERRLLGGTG